jgi:hypothetical protein
MGDYLYQFIGFEVGQNGLCSCLEPCVFSVSSFKFGPILSFSLYFVLITRSHFHLSTCKDCEARSDNDEGNKLETAVQQNVYGGCSVKFHTELRITANFRKRMVNKNFHSWSFYCFILRAVDLYILRM